MAVQLLSQRWQVYLYNQIKDEIPNNGEGVVIKACPSFPDVNVFVMGDNIHTIKELVMRISSVPQVELEYIPVLGQLVMGTVNMGTAIVQLLLIGDGTNNVQSLINNYIDTMRKVVNYQWIPSSDEKAALAGTSLPSEQNPYVTKDTHDDAIETEARARDEEDTVIKKALVAEAQDRENEDNRVLDEAKNYTDKTMLATHTWLPSVDLKSDLPVGGLNKKLNYLCRVIADPVLANNGVYQAIAGWTTAPVWKIYSKNADWIDENELKEAIASHNTSNSAHSGKVEEGNGTDISTPAIGSTSVWAMLQAIWNRIFALNKTKVTANDPISPISYATKITYDSKGLVTSGAQIGLNDVNGYNISSIASENLTKFSAPINNHLVLWLQNIAGKINGIITNLGNKANKSNDTLTGAYLLSTTCSTPAQNSSSTLLANTYYVDRKIQSSLYDPGEYSSLPTGNILVVYQ